MCNGNSCVLFKHETCHRLSDNVAASDNNAVFAAAIDIINKEPVDETKRKVKHSKISQSADTSWFQNKYGNYMFNNEYDTDDCYFVDNTNIINGMGGNWRTTNDVPVVNPQPKPQPVGADQILYKGSKVKFDGIFKVDILKAPVSSNLFGCTKMTGCSFANYQANRVKDYHWIPTNDFDECDSNGNLTNDQVLSGGNSYVKNDKIYNVEEIDIPSNSARLVINGRSVWIKSSCLYEVSNN